MPATAANITRATVDNPIRGQPIAGILPRTYNIEPMTYLLPRTA